jgi:membrane protein DedA with SNARE-associated domain
VTDFVVLLAVAVVASVIAVWFGRRVVAPRIERALDRAESEEAVDRHD